jgi:hypothetical protein
MLRGSALFFLLACAGCSSSMSSDDAEQCSAATSKPSARDAVVVRLVNQTKAPIYVGPTQPGCASSAQFRVRLADGTEGKPILDGCETSCANAASASTCACSMMCAQGFATRIEPGHALEASWGGTLFAAATLPKGCAANDTCSHCLAEKLAPIGATTIAATAYDAAEGCDGAACACPAGANGVCSSGTFAKGDRLDATATWGGEAKLDVVFR